MDENQIDLKASTGLSRGRKQRYIILFFPLLFLIAIMAGSHFYLEWVQKLDNAQYELPQWSPDSTKLLAQSLATTPEGEEKTQFSILHRQGGEPQAVLWSPFQKEQSIEALGFDQESKMLLFLERKPLKIHLLPLDQDGKLQSFSLQKRPYRFVNRDQDLLFFSVDKGVPRERIVVSADDFNPHQDLPSNEESYPSRHQSEIFAFDLQTQKLTPCFTIQHQPQDKIRIQKVRYSPQNQTYIYTLLSQDDQDQKSHSLWVYDAKNDTHFWGRLRSTQPFSFRWSPDEKALIVLSQHDESTSLMYSDDMYYLDLRNIATIKELEAKYFGWKDEQQLWITTQDELYTVELQTGKTEKSSLSPTIKENFRPSFHGKWVTFVSQPERDRILVFQLDSKQENQVSPQTQRQQYQEHWSYPIASFIDNARQFYLSF